MNVDSETVCLRLLIKGLIVPIRLCILSIAYFFITDSRIICRVFLSRSKFQTWDVFVI